MRADGGLWVPGALAPGTPSAGNVIYPKADGMWYTKDSAGVEVLVGSKNVPTPSASTDSANKAYVDAQVTGMAAVGQQLGLATRLTTFACTNTSLFSTAAGAIIPSLSVSVTGTGRPVQIEFRAPYFSNSVGGNINLSVYFVRTTPSSGGTTIAHDLTIIPAVGSTGAGVYLSSTQTLTSGTTYKYEVAGYTLSGNTVTFQAGATAVWGADWPMYLSVTQR